MLHTELARFHRSSCSLLPSCAPCPHTFQLAARWDVVSKDDVQSNQSTNQAALHGVLLWCVESVCRVFVILDCSRSVQNMLRRRRKRRFKSDRPSNRVCPHTLAPNPACFDPPWCNRAAVQAAPRCVSKRERVLSKSARAFIVRTNYTFCTRK